MAVKTVTIERHYSVSYRSGELHASLNVLSIPISIAPELRDLMAPHRPSLTRELTESVFGFRSVLKAGSPDLLDKMLATLIARAMGLDIGLIVTRGQVPQSVFDFVAQVANEPFVPVEHSPLSGESLSTLAKNSSLLTFATVGETYGLLHHDAVVLLLTPLCAIVLGATVGTGEGLRDRIRDYLTRGAMMPGRERPPTKEKPRTTRTRKKAEFPKRSDN